TLKPGRIAWVNIAIANTKFATPMPQILSWWTHKRMWSVSSGLTRKAGETATRQRSRRLERLGRRSRTGHESDAGRQWANVHGDQRHNGQVLRCERDHNRRTGRCAGYVDRRSQID